MHRRQLLRCLAAAWLSGASGVRAADAPAKRRRILFFSRSVLFEHPVIRRQGGELSFGEKEFVSLAGRLNCDVDCTKDGTAFDGDLAKYAAVASYSCGNSTDLMKDKSLDGGKPLSEQGWRNLDAAVRKGLPLVGIHPGIWLLPRAFGGDVLGHGSQQAAKILVASPRFPGLEGLDDSFSLLEEWFSCMRFAQDLHVILVQDCSAMSKEQPSDRQCYDRAPFPATWARMYGQGRVFYTSMGHREDVWTSKVFQQVLLAGLAWSLGDVQADLAPNLERLTPLANDFPKVSVRP